MTTSVLGFDKIVDYNSRFTGLMLEQFKRGATIPLSWVTVDGVENWKAICLNRNTGRFRLAVAYSAVYRSDDYGKTWTKISGDGNQLPTAYWWTCAMSRDGHIQFVSEGRDNVVGGGGYIWRSADFGVTWARVNSIDDPTRLWAAIAVSENGDSVVAVVHNWTADGISYSHDSGVTWTTATITGRDWIAVKITKDGQKMYAAADTREVWVSTNGGASWAIMLSENRRWNSIGISDDGTYITITTHINDPSEIPIGNGLIWQSSDGGSHWSGQSPSGVPDQWNGATMTGDGQYQYVFKHGHDPVFGHVWISSDYGQTFVEDVSSPWLEWWSLAVTLTGALYFTAVGAHSQIFNYHQQEPTSPIKVPVVTPAVDNSPLKISQITDYSTRAFGLTIEQLKYQYGEKEGAVTVFDWQDSDEGQEYQDGDTGQEYQAI